MAIIQSVRETLSQRERQQCLRRQLHALELLEMAQMEWRRLDGSDGSQLLPLVAHRVKYRDGVRLENKEDRAA